MEKYDAGLNLKMIFITTLETTMKLSLQFQSISISVFILIKPSDSVSIPYPEYIFVHSRYQRPIKYSAVPLELELTPMGEVSENIDACS